MIVEADADMAERHKWLKQQTPLHESRVAKAADGFQAERLLPLTDSHCPQQRYAGFFNSDVRKCRAAEKAKVHLQHIARGFRHQPLRRQPRATEIRAILNLPVGRFAG